MSLMRIRVMTYNIRHGLGSDGKQDLARILPVLDDSRADIICLQEVDRRLPRSGFVDQAAWLADRLDFHHAVGINFGVLSLAGMGNALLSRWPFYSTWNTRLPSAGEPRGLLCYVVILTAHVGFAVFCTHWGLSDKQRLRQADATAARLTQPDQPYLLCGDFNAQLDSPEIERLMEIGSLQDAGPAGALTYPADRPEAKIDYVLYSGHWTLRESRVVSSLASDHLPLVVDLELTT